MSDERDDPLTEAGRILRGETMILTQKQHLEAVAQLAGELLAALSDAQETIHGEFCGTNHNELCGRYDALFAKAVAARLTREGTAK